MTPGRASRAAPAAPAGAALSPQISSKRSSSFKRAIANGQRALPRDVLLDETGLGIYKRFVRYVAYEILPCEMDRRWYFYQHRTCPPPVFMAAVTLTQVRARAAPGLSLLETLAGIRVGVDRLGEPGCGLLLHTGGSELIGGMCDLGWDIFVSVWGTQSRGSGAG